MAKKKKNLNTKKHITAASQTKTASDADALSSNNQHPASSIQHPAPSIKYDFFWIFTFSLVLRIILIIRNPAVYEFDGYCYLLGLMSEYPLFTGFIKLLIASGLSVFAIRIIVAIIGSAACVTFYLFVSRVFKNNTIARVSAGLMSIYPPFLTFSIVPYTESLFLLLLFCGLWCFEKENHAEETKSYVWTGLFLGLACLTRYEAWLILPLIFIRMLSCKKTLHSAYKNLLPICAILAWGPVCLLIYKYTFLRNMTVYQSQESQNLIKEMLVLLDGIIHTGLPRLFKELAVRGLMFPVWIFAACVVIAAIGCILAIIRDKHKHLPYAVFIILALGIQIMPIALNYRDYPGHIIGLRRHGMVSAVFLLSYLAYGFDVLIKSVRWSKIWQTAALLILLAAPVAACFKTSDFTIGDYQKLYRNSYVEPYWIGKPGDAKYGVITSVSPKNLRPMGRGLSMYEAKELAHMSLKEVQNFIRQKRIKYILLEKYTCPEFDKFFIKEQMPEFRQIAGVGGWLYVYVLEKSERSEK